MSLKEEVLEVKQQLQEVKEKGFAMEILSDYKKANKRMFIALLTVLVMWFSTVGAFVYYICNYTYEEEIITETVTTDDGGNACIGDGCNNGTINGESN
jgi:hypothetical protein